MLKYFAYRPLFAPAIANETPTSTTSGARESPLSEAIAWFSWAELPSGLSFVIPIPYFFGKSCSSLAVVRPVGREGDRVQVPFLLRRLDEVGETGRASSFVGGAASRAVFAPSAVLALPSTVRPKAAAALRRSIDERLIPSSSSLAQNSISWAS